MDGIGCNGFIFYNNFDSANLAKVDYVPFTETVSQPTHTNSSKILQEIPDAEFNIWTKPDCSETEYENGNRTWFYFSIKAPSPNLLVKLNIVNLNRQGKMYSQGMAPVYRIVPGKMQWERIRDKPTYNTNNNIFTLSFKFKTPENVNSVIYFAFTYPFSYTELQKMLQNYDSKYLDIVPLSQDDIYYVRESVCNSLEGRDVDLLTITSYHGMTSERETRLKYLFPNDNILRPFKFIGKKVVFISARVHPGETPSSFVFNGFLNLLLTRDDPVAIILRRLYVFKMIPFLNPDGVARGHYRTDTKGVNLNRVYLNPIVTEHPTIYAARALLRYYHYGFEKDDITQCKNCLDVLDSTLLSDTKQSDNNISMRVSHMSLKENCNNNYKNVLCKKCIEKGVKINKWTDLINELEDCIDNFDNNDNILSNNETSDQENSNESGLFLYIDMHGHASKKGIFMYGNHFNDMEQNIECMLLPKLMSINNHNFHFTSCNFTERNMYLKDKRDGMSRAGSGRVAVLKITGLIRSYTLECNYNTGRLVNVLPSCINEAHLKVQNILVPPKYTPQVFEGVGKSLGMSILDLTGQNPYTRIPHSEFHTLTGLRDWIRFNCCNETGEFENMRTTKMKSKKHMRNQDKTTHDKIVKSRPTTTVKTTTKKLNKSRAISVPVDRKENVVYRSNNFVPQPSCSSHTSDINHVKSTGTRYHKSFGLKSKLKKDSSLKLKNNVTGDKQKNLLNRNKARNSSLAVMKKSNDSKNINNSQSNIATESNCNNNKNLKDDQQEIIKLGEICVMKSTDGKTFVTKYKTNNTSKEVFNNSNNNLMVAWDKSNKILNVSSNKVLNSEPGPSKQGPYRVHNFTRSSTFSKTKVKKLTLRRLTSSAESTGKIDKIKKRRKLKSK